MKIRLSASILVGTALLAASANATEFYIDELRIEKNGASWFVDGFGDGNPPPLSEGVFPGEAGTPTVPEDAPASYLTRPNPLPGPEANGKLTLDASLEPVMPSGITGAPIRQQGARLLSDISPNMDLGLKSNDTFTVTGVFDLTPPQQVDERVGIRLVDFGSGSVNDLVAIGVILTSTGDVRVGFRHADFDLDVFNVLDSRSLSGIDPDFDQIALSLSKSSASSNQITAKYELIDTDNIEPNQVVLLDNLKPGDEIPELFHGESWTRVEFAAVQLVPVPAALPLFASALGLSTMLGWRRKASA